MIQKGRGRKRGRERVGGRREERGVNKVKEGEG